MSLEILTLLEMVENQGIPVFEDISNFHQNLENAISFEAITESEYYVDNFLESHINGEGSDTILAEDFDCETCCGECQVVLRSHTDCQVTTKFRRGWPASLRYLRYCKFCKLDNLITYQRGDHQVLQRCLLDVSDLNYGSIPQFTGFVLDSSDGARLCCDQIDAGQYSRQGCFPFTDKPSSTWPFQLIGYEDHHLVEINKKQDFLLYLVAVPEIGEETPLKCWKWSETLEYHHPSGGCTCAASKPVEEDLAKFPFPSEICQLPTANDRKYLIQLADLSLGTPEAVIIPPGFTQRSL